MLPACREWNDAHSRAISPPVLRTYFVDFPFGELAVVAADHRAADALVKSFPVRHLHREKLGAGTALSINPNPSESETARLARLAPGG